MGLLMTSMRRLGSAGEWTAQADEAAARYGVDPSVLLAVIEVESSGDPAARGAAGEVGLMQVMPATAQMVRPGISEAELWDPATNVDVGAAYFARQLQRYGGDVAAAISAYNAGTATPRNQSYVDRVLGAIGTWWRGDDTPTPVDAPDCCADGGPGGVGGWMQAHPYLTVGAALAALWWWRTR
jgi:hypothetical protein